MEVDFQGFPLPELNSSLGWLQIVQQAVKLDSPLVLKNVAIPPTKRSA